MAHVGDGTHPGEDGDRLDTKSRHASMLPDEFRNAINYSLRYGQGNKLDRDRNISDVVRNLVLNHAPSSGTFQGHYLNRNVGIDVQALHRGIEAQQSLIQQDTSHGHSRDARRPVAFPDGQMERALAKSRKYFRLTEELARLPSGLRHAEQRRRLTNARVCTTLPDPSRRAQEGARGVGQRPGCRRYRTPDRRRRGVWTARGADSNAWCTANEQATLYRDCSIQRRLCPTRLSLRT